MKKVIKLIGLILIIMFFIVFINRNNYYEDEKILSEEAIKRFEKDLKNGEEINPNNYITEKKDYNHSISKLGMSVSKSIEFVVGKSLRKVLRYIDN